MDVGCAGVTAYVALLRAVNVGGTGKMPMQDLKVLCIQAGFDAVRTYLASGNVVFHSASAADGVRQTLEAKLGTYAGRRIGVLVRSAGEVAEVVRRNPFPQEPGARVGVLFTDAPLPSRPLDGASGLGGEEVRVGERELFVFFPDGMGRSRLRLPAGREGTMRNMNTVAALAKLASR